MGRGPLGSEWSTVEVVFRDRGNRKVTRSCPVDTFVVTETYVGKKTNVTGKETRCG